MRELEFDKDFLIKFGDVIETDDNRMDLTIEPATIQAIGSAASMVFSWLSSNDQKKWQEEVSRNLGIILRNTELILTELIEMRVFFKEELKAAFINDISIRLNSKREMLEDMLRSIESSERITTDQRNILKQLSYDTSSLIYHLLGYGFAGITGVAAGVFTYCAICSWLGTPRDAIPLLKRTQDFFASALSNNVSGSFESTKISLDNTIQTLSSHLKSFPQTGYLGFNEDYIIDNPCTPGTCLNYGYYLYSSFYGTIIETNNTNKYQINVSSTSRSSESNPRKTQDFPNFPHQKNLGKSSNYVRFAETIQSHLNGTHGKLVESIKSKEKITGYILLLRNLEAQTNEVIRKISIQ